MKTSEKTGTIIHTRDKKKESARKAKKQREKRSLAKQCDGCKSNEGGFCTKYRSWSNDARKYCEKCREKLDPAYDSDVNKSSIVKKRKQRRKE